MLQIQRKLKNSVCRKLVWRKWDAKGTPQNHNQKKIKVSQRNLRQTKKAAARKRKEKRSPFFYSWPLSFYFHWINILVKWTGTNCWAGILTSWSAAERTTTLIFLLIFWQLRAKTQRAPLKRAWWFRRNRMQLHAAPLIFIGNRQRNRAEWMFSWELILRRNKNTTHNFNDKVRFLYSKETNTMSWVQIYSNEFGKRQLKVLTGGHGVCVLFINYLRIVISLCKITQTGWKKVQQHKENDLKKINSKS